MKLIPLSKGKWAKVDDEDFEWLMKYVWYCSTSGYACRSGGGGSHIMMHREIMRTPPYKEVDHINADRIDNQKQNMVNVNSRSNLQKKRTNTSGYIGVHPRKDSATFWAEIRVNYKKIYLGAFETAKEAALAYDAAVKKYLGPNHLLNFADERADH